MARQTRDIEALAQLCHILGDQTRLRILQALQDGERNVTSLCDELKLPQPTVSRHLAILRMAGLTNNRRAGKEVLLLLERLHRRGGDRRHEVHAGQHGRRSHRPDHHRAGEEVAASASSRSRKRGLAPQRHASSRCGACPHYRLRGGEPKVHYGLPHHGQFPSQAGLRAVRRRFVHPGRPPQGDHRPGGLRGRPAALRVKFRAPLRTGRCPGRDADRAVPGPPPAGHRPPGR